MRFDWYQATIEADPFSVLSSVEKLGSFVEQDDKIARRYRYDQGFSVHHHERGLVARVFWGGNGKNPHAFASGQDTDAFVDLVRSEWPDRHLVTRMDSAEDFYEEGAYDRILRVSKRIAKDHHLQFPKIEDELNPIAGRTQYIGGKKSDYRGRLYEKGWEVVQKSAAFHGGVCTEFHGMVVNELTGEFVDPSMWVRLELQGRPSGEDARRAAAAASPSQAWTFTSWSTDLAEAALNLELERFYVRTRKFSKDEMAFRWMCRQYGAMLTRRCLSLGDWSLVGVEIGDLLNQLTKSGKV